MKSAEQQLLESLDQMLVEQSNNIVIPLSKINQGIANTVTSNAKTVNKLIGKVLKQIARETVNGSDAIDGVNTRVLQGLDQWLLNQEFLLQSLAQKSGDIAIGDPLTSLLSQSTTETPQVTYAGTLVLELSKLEPLARQLIEVLREIRDRMPFRPEASAGEPASRAPAEAEPIDLPPYEGLASLDWEDE